MTEEYEASPYPLDFDALDYGSTLAAEVVAEAVLAKDGLRPDDLSYWTGSLRLKGAIENHFQTERGQVVTTCMDHGSIRILTHSEALAYNHRARERNAKAMARTQVRTVGIDRTALTEGEQKDLDREMLRNSYILQAVHQAKTLSLPPPSVGGG